MSLDEHRQLQLAAALDLPRVGALGVAHPQRDVADQLLRPGARRIWRAVSLSPSLPASGEVLTPIVIDSDGSSTVIDRQRTRVVGVGQRLADRDLGDAGDGDDLARAGLVGVDAVQRVGDVAARRPGPLDCAVGATPGDRLARGGCVPWRTRQIARRPTYGEASRLVTSACSGWSGS